MKNILPRISYILGEKNNPLKPHEKFIIDGVPNNPHHFCEDMPHLYDADGDNSDFYVPFIINHPEKIIRRPQFSEDEKALMRLYVTIGFPIFHRNEDGTIQARNRACTEAWMFPPEILPNLTFSIGEFDAAAYLESEAAK